MDANKDLIMMDSCAFAMWKFKTIEGVMEGVQSGDVCSTHFDNGRVKAEFTYSPSAERMVVLVKGETTPLIECSFRDAVNELKKHKLYVERTKNRHGNSYLPYEFPK